MMATKVRVREYFASSGPEVTCETGRGDILELDMPPEDSYTPKDCLRIFTKDSDGDVTEVFLDKEDLGRYIGLLQKFHAQLPG